MSKFEWFRNAGLGMFIHWGVYSVRGRGEWSLVQKNMTLAEYDAAIPEFTADAYDPEEWVAAARAGGMEYIVLTAKHHDGFCLFNTATTERNAVKMGPRRDLFGDYVKACRKGGLKIGVYFSLPDWTEPAFFSGPVNDPQGWREFLERSVFTQLRELCSNYGPLDLLWYDNITGMSDGRRRLCQENFREAEALAPAGRQLTAEDYRSAELNALLRGFQPGILINDRSLLPEDFYTAEQNLRPPSEKGRLWQACMTMNRHWGYFPTDVYYKSAYDIIHAITATACGGGHLLLNVGPNRHGAFNAFEKERLEAVGRWMSLHAESVKGVEPVAIPGGNYGCAARKGKNAYLYVHYPEDDGTVTIPHCDLRPKKAELMENGKAMDIFYHNGNIILKGAPAFKKDWIPVIKLEME